MKQQYYDFLEFKQDVSITEDGYLEVKACPITRTGVFPYKRNDSIRFEAKTPEELFSDETVSSAIGKPITDNHPKEFVNADNFNKLAKGYSLSDAKVEDDCLKVSLVVTDSSMIDKVKKGKKQLSIGFIADVIEKQGELNGQRYDAIQENIKINHIAIVDKGRAGSKVAIADSAIMIEDEGGNKMVEVELNGKTFNIDEDVAEAIKVEQENIKKEANSNINEKEEKLKELVAEKDKLQAALDAKIEEIKELKANADSSEEIEKEIERIISLRTNAKKFVGDSYDFSGKDEREIKVDAIKMVYTDFDDTEKSDEYINARYDMLEEINKHSFKGSKIEAKKDEVDELAEIKAKRLNMKGE